MHISKLPAAIEDVWPIVDDKGIIVELVRTWDDDAFVCLDEDGQPVDDIAHTHHLVAKEHFTGSDVPGEWNIVDVRRVSSGMTQLEALTAGHGDCRRQPTDRDPHPAQRRCRHRHRRDRHDAAVHAHRAARRRVLPRADAVGGGHGASGRRRFRARRPRRDPAAGGRAGRSGRASGAAGPQPQAAAPASAAPKTAPQPDAPASSQSQAAAPASAAPKTAPATADPDRAAGRADDDDLDSGPARAGVCDGRSHRPGRVGRRPGALGQRRDRPPGQRGGGEGGGGRRAAATQTRPGGPAPSLAAVAKADGMPEVEPVRSGLARRRRDSGWAEVAEGGATLAAVATPDAPTGDSAVSRASHRSPATTTSPPGAMPPTSSRRSPARSTRAPTRRGSRRANREPCRRTDCARRSIPMKTGSTGRQ